MALEELIQKVSDILDEEADNYEWGGSEDQYGVLQPGVVNFDEIRVKINEAIEEAWRTTGGEQK